MSLRIDLTTADPFAARTDCLAVAVFESDLRRQPLVRALDDALDGALLAHAKRAEFTGKAEQVLDLPSLGLVTAHRLVLVGLGEPRSVSNAGVRVFAATAARAARDVATLRVAVPERLREHVRALAEGFELGAYRFAKYLTGSRKPKTPLTKIVLHLEGGRLRTAERAAATAGQGVGRAVTLARDAVNEPANTLTPAALAGVARDVAKHGNLAIKVLDGRGIRRAGMTLHAAVAQGSANDPRFIHLTYSPKGRAKERLIFVGKGLTFDSGGLCIKPPGGMEAMKADMGGAAAVLGLMAAVGALRPAVEVHGIIGAAENMPDANAYRPGDVFGSLDGKTVEIINTDAEGRLVLADALAYARELAPDLLVDIATLTGACVVALGETYSAFYTADDGLADRFAGAATRAGESFWRMPLIEEIREQLKSNVADLKHVGNRYGGSISAALFLQEFVGDAPWVHCDIAGPVMAEKARGIYGKGGTGHAVLTFLELVESGG